MRRSRREGHGRGGAALSRRASLARAGPLARGRHRCRARVLPPVRARCSSIRSRSPAEATTSSCTRASPTTTPPGATPCTSVARSSRRTTRDSRSWRRASSRGSAAPWSRKAPAVLAENAEVAEHVLERIRAEGPLSSLDFERRAAVPMTDWFGAPTNVVRAVLEAYAVTGVLGLARRDGSRRYYDLLERLLPADVLAQRHPARRAAPAQAALALPRARPARRQRRRTSSAASARRSRTRGGPGTRVERRCARSSIERRRARSGRRRGRARQAVRARGGGRAARGPAASRRRPSHSSRPSTRSSGTGRCSGPCSSSTTSGSSSPRRRSGAGAGTCCRSSSATASSAGSSRASTATAARRGARSLVGGRLRAAARAEGFVEAMRDALARTCVSPALAASSGRRTSEPRRSCSAPAPSASPVVGISRSQQDAKN